MARTAHRPKTSTSHSGTSAKVRSVVRTGDDIRARVRDLTTAALRDGSLTSRGISRFVDDVLSGASAGLDASMPASRNSALRQVFDGLSDAMEAIASTGQSVARGMRTRGKAIMNHDLPNASRHAASGSAEFLDAVTKFASKVSGEIGEELVHLVSRARRESPRVMQSTARAAAAADGRMIEMGGEAATAGMQVARRAVGGLVKAASGLLEGIADSIAPRRGSPAGRPRTATRRPTAPGKHASPRGARKSKRRAGMSTARRTARSGARRKPGRTAR